MKLLSCFQPFGVLEDPTKDLRASKNKLKEEILILNKKMEHAARIYHMCWLKKLDINKKYKEEDFKLAKLDGRYKIVEPFKPEKTKKEKKKEVKALEKLLGNLSNDQKKELISKMMKGVI
jgi:hypothetical protein